jgi:hypothetical protein
MVFIAEAFAGWLIGQLADAGRKRLTEMVLGGGQKQALEQAATAAIYATARQLRPSPAIIDDAQEAQHLARVIDQVFELAPTTAGFPVDQATLLQGLQAGVAARLAVLGDAELTGTGKSSAEVLGVTVTEVTETLVSNLLREIVISGASGGPLWPLADQLNHDLTHLQSQQQSASLAWLTNNLQAALRTLERLDQQARPTPLGRTLTGRAIEELGRSELREADPYQVGVYESTIATRYQAPGASRPPYVPRAKDQILAQLLAQSKRVLVVGRSRVGKSRSAFEVAASVFPKHRLVVPRDRAELLQLAAFNPPPWRPASAVIWLDELERYLPTETDDGLDATLLAHLEQIPGVVVLATMRSEERDSRQYIAGELGQRIRRTLQRFQPATVAIPVDFAEEHEQQAIARLYPGLPMQLAEHLAAVPELRRKLDDATPVQHALVQAAVDWRRAGLDRPANTDDLWALAERTLDTPGRLPQVAIQQRTQLDGALNWACEPVADTAALLERHSEPSVGYRATDPIVDYLADQSGSQLSSPAAWEILLSCVRLQEMLQLAAAAWSLGSPHIARGALTTVVRDGEPAVANVMAATLFTRVH